MGRVLDFVEIISVRDVFQYFSQYLSLNGYRRNGSTIWLDNFLMPFASKAWPYNSDDELAHILVGCKRELHFSFYNICGLCPYNWNIISNLVTSFTSSSNQANSHIASARSSSHSHTALVLAQNMDITTILNEARTKEKTIATLSRKTTAKKNNKGARLEEITLEIGSSECPPLT
ncbi:hypothetical protein J1N35_019052 [Gossypium stocksii]|uniref:Uncharacterized protein n=1 Tax=Gossypium stocksii TaxID=47602 RepID=A0A9D4A7R5_9ROSI|nr:hypothetical protein J1N35_019052 [Gossypium stocksii]